MSCKERSGIVSEKVLGVDFSEFCHTYNLFNFFLCVLSCAQNYFIRLNFVVRVHKVKIKLELPHPVCTTLQSKLIPKITSFKAGKFSTLSDTDK